MPSTAVTTAAAKRGRAFFSSTPSTCTLPEGSGTIFASEEWGGEGGGVQLDFEAYLQVVAAIELSPRTPLFGTSSFFLMVSWCRAAAGVVPQLVLSCLHTEKEQVGNGVLSRRRNGVRSIKTSSRRNRRQMIEILLEMPPSPPLLPEFLLQRRSVHCISSGSWRSTLLHDLCDVSSTADGFEHRANVQGGFWFRCLPT